MAVASDRSALAARIVEVAVRRLADEGAGALTTRGVADAAGVQAPTLYRLFGDKDGLLEAVAEHLMDTHARAKGAEVQAETAADRDPVDDLRAAWSQQIEFGLANPTVFRLLSDPDRVARSPAARAGRGLLEARVRRVAESGRLRVPEHRAVDLVQAGGLGVIQTLLATPVEERDPGLADAMLETVLAQVLLDPAHHADPGPVATAVAFRALAPRLAALTEPERRLLVEWTDRALESL